MICIPERFQTTCKKCNAKMIFTNSDIQKTETVEKVDEPTGLDVVLAVMNLFITSSSETKPQSYDIVKTERIDSRHERQYHEFITCPECQSRIGVQDRKTTMKI